MWQNRFCQIAQTTITRVAAGAPILFLSFSEEGGIRWQLINCLLIKRIRLRSFRQADIVERLLTSAIAFSAIDGSRKL